LAAPAPADARGGFGPGLFGGLVAGALIGGLASNAYGYGPGYGYYGGYGPGYYGGYAPRRIPADMPPPTMTIMHPHITATVTGELCVQHSPTRVVVPDIMAAGITGGIVIGNKQ
jgi:hypothetical protein